MSTTQHIGPFFKEQNGHFVMIRSQKKFRARMCVELPVSHEGLLYMLPAMPLNSGVSLVLSAEGHEDVIVQGGQG